MRVALIACAAALVVALLCAAPTPIAADGGWISGRATYYDDA